MKDSDRVKQMMVVVLAFLVNWGWILEFNNLRCNEVIPNRQYLCLVPPPFVLHSILAVLLAILTLSVVVSWFFDWLDKKRSIPNDNH